jgi:O-antigen ligase
MISVALLLIITQALTLSRGGWTATACSLIFLLVVLFFQKDFYHERVLIAITAFSLVVMVFVLINFPIVERITTLTQQNPVDNIQGRLRTWSGTAALIQDHVLTGTGPGTFVVAYPAYQTPGAATLSDYAHNDYLQFIADTGIFIVPVILWALFFLLKTGFTKLKSQSHQTRGFSLGAMTAVVAIAIHSLSDFNLHIPANIILFTILAGTLSKQRVL